MSTVPFLRVPVTGKALNRDYKDVSEDREPTGAMADEMGFGQGKASQTRCACAALVLYYKLWE